MLAEEGRLVVLEVQNYGQVVYVQSAVVGTDGHVVRVQMLDGLVSQQACFGQGEGPVVSVGQSVVQSGPGQIVRGADLGQVGPGQQVADSASGQVDHVLTTVLAEEGHLPVVIELQTGGQVVRVPPAVGGPVS